MIAATEQEDLAAARGEGTDRLVHGRAQLAPEVERLRRFGGRHLVTADALDPRADDMLVPQVLQRPMSRRDEQVGPGETYLVAGGVPARVPEMEKQILHDVLGGVRRPDEAKDVLAQLDVRCLKGRFPTRGSVDSDAEARGRLPHTDGYEFCKNSTGGRQCRTGATGRGVRQDKQRPGSLPGAVFSFRPSGRPTVRYGVTGGVHGVSNPRASHSPAGTIMLGNT